MRTDQILTKLSNKTSYHRADLLAMLQREKKNVSDSTFRWTLYNLLQQQKIFKIDYDSYVFDKPKQLPKYKPFYSEQALNLIQLLESLYPELEFVVFESVLLNEFLNHQISQNTIYLQVEKDVSSYIFDVLKEQYPGNVLYKPSQKDFDRYWISDCIVVVDLVSQAPVSLERKHEMTIEKMLVDIIAEKSLEAVYSQSELPFVFENVIKSYRVDRRKLNRYAGRRGKSAEISRILGGD
jgi:hypothetical protein